MSMRNPLEKARGHGSAKEGVHHWYAQRASALLLLALTGWLVFASGDANNTYESATDTLLGTGLIDLTNVTVITNSTSDNNLEYNADGTTNEAGGTARFAVCDKRGGAHGRQINVPPHGRPKFVKGDTTNPINCTSPS